MLIGVTEARAKVGSIQVTPELLANPQAFAQFQAAQGQLTQALKSLFAVAEAYPDLKSDANFRDLQAQLEGTENRIAVARNRYIAAVQSFNTTVRKFPDQSDRQDVRLRGEAQLHRGGRDGDRDPTHSRLRHGCDGPRRQRSRHRRRRRPRNNAAMRSRAALWALPLLLSVSAWAQVPVPPLEARVTDLTGTLTAEQQAALENKLAAFESRKGSQVAVLLVPTTRAGRYRPVRDPRRRAMEARAGQGR